jgi:hypothetical protein
MARAQSDVLPAEAGCQSREDGAAYGDNIEVEKSRLNLENTRVWQFSSYPKAS